MVVKHSCFKMEYHHQSHQSLALAVALAVALVAVARAAVVLVEQAPAVAHCPSYQKTVALLAEGPLVAARLAVALDRIRLAAD